jgi:hypothetical protein
VSSFSGEHYRAGPLTPVILLRNSTAPMPSGMHNCYFEMTLHDSNCFAKGSKRSPFTIFSNAVTTGTRSGLRLLRLWRKPGHAQLAMLLWCQGATLFTRKEKELSLNASPRRRKSVEPHAYSGLCHNLGIPCSTEKPPSESTIEGSKCLRVQAAFREKNMEHSNTQRRAIGLLVIFATVLTLITAWNLPETASIEK